MNERSGSFFEALDEVVAEALQGFDGSNASAFAAGERLADAAQTSRFDEGLLIAAGLRHAWLMGRRSVGHFDGPDQVRDPNRDLQPFRDAYKPEFPHDPMEDTFMGSADALKVRSVEWLHVDAGADSQSSRCGKPGAVVDDPKNASCPWCLSDIPAPKPRDR